MINWINKSQHRIPKKSTIRFLRRVLGDLKFKKDLSVVFLDAKKAKALNKTYRKKNYATDILSFSLNELVLCPAVIRRQAHEHHLSFENELRYLLIHGILHLLGHEHEKSAAKAKKMFRIQDKLFEKYRC